MFLGGSLTCPYIILTVSFSYLLFRSIGDGVLDLGTVKLSLFFFLSCCHWSEAMASRVFVRYGRLLCRASSQTPTAVTARLLPIVAAEVHRSLLWATVVERLMCEGRTAKKDDTFLTMPSRTQLDELVDKAGEPEDILLAWVDHAGNGNQAASALKKWTYLVLKTKGRFREQPPELLKDPRLQNMLTTLSQQVAKPETHLNYQPS